MQPSVEFYVVTLVHQALSEHAPSYLADDCCLVIHARPRRLHSADTRMLLVIRTRTNFGDRAFSAAGPRVWNNLPMHLIVEKVTEDVFTRAVGPQRSEKPFNCALEMLLFAYLLIY